MCFMLQSQWLFPDCCAICYHSWFTNHHSAYSRHLRWRCMHYKVVHAYIVWNLLHSLVFLLKMDVFVCVKSNRIDGFVSCVSQRNHIHASQFTLYSVTMGNNNFIIKMWKWAHNQTWILSSPWQTGGKKTEKLPNFQSHF